MTDEELLERFERQAVPADAWNHRAHLRVAYLYLRRFEFETALQRMRAGIRALNAAHDVPDSRTSGYHETVTHAWLRILSGALEAHGPAATSAAFLDLHPELSQRTLLRRFYSRDRIMTLEAKRKFVAPDLAPLPKPTD